jgi:hypothetical protein
MSRSREYNHSAVLHQHKADFWEGNAYSRRYSSLTTSGPLPRRIDETEMTTEVPVGPITSSATASPPGRETPKKSFRKIMSKSLGRAGDKSIRSIVGMYGSMKDALTRDERDRRSNAIEIAMAETTQYLNGFSKRSAFKRDYHELLLRELGDVHAKYATETNAAAARTKCKGKQARSDPPGGGSEAADGAEGILPAETSSLIKR